jgi:hypothetical protein
MKFLVVLSILFSFYSFAKTECKDIKLKDNVEACYYKPMPLANAGFYTIEYTCKQVTKISKRGEKYSFTKSVDEKSYYLLHEKCTQVVDYLQKHQEFPGFWDSVDMTGEAIGIPKQ